MFRYPKNSGAGRKAGQLLAGGYFGVLWSIKGDLEFLANVIDIPRWSLKSGPCCLCRCNGDGELTWADFTPNAPWIATCWTPSSWQGWANKSKNLLFTLPGVTILSVCLDYMHVKYLGLDQYIFGSTLSMLVHFVMTGSPLDNLQRCWTFIQGYYKHHHTEIKYRYLNRLSMFVRKKKGPKLRGKACEVKSFGSVLLALWQKYMKSSIQIHQQIAMMLKLNCRMESLINEHKDEVTFPDASADDFRDSAFAMCALQQTIANHFAEDGNNLFSTTSKNHMLLHIAMMARHINPRLTWCFTGEDMMHKCQVLIKACVHGVQGPQACVKAGEHYRLGLHLLLNKTI